MPMMKAAGLAVGTAMVSSSPYQTYPMWAEGSKNNFAQAHEAVTSAESQHAKPLAQVNGAYATAAPQHMQQTVGTHVNVMRSGTFPAGAPTAPNVAQIGPMKGADPHAGTMTDLSRARLSNYSGATLEQSQSHAISMAAANGLDPTHGVTGMSNMVPLPFMETHIATQALVQDQQRRIEQLQKELSVAQMEIQRLKNQALELEREKVQKEGNQEDGKKSSSRYWTPEEHQRFLEGLEMYGHKEIKSISRYVRTRNATQVRTHAQKYYLRLQREKGKKGAEDGAQTQSSGRHSDDGDAGQETLQSRPVAGIDEEDVSTSGGRPGKRVGPVSMRDNDAARERTNAEDFNAPFDSLNGDGGMHHDRGTEAVDMDTARESQGVEPAEKTEQDFAYVRGEDIVPKVAENGVQAATTQTPGAHTGGNAGSPKRPRLSSPGGTEAANADGSAGVPSQLRAANGTSMGAMSVLGESDRGLLSYGFVPDVEERGRLDAGDGSHLFRAELKRTNSIISLLGGRGGTGCGLSESPSTEKMLSLFQEHDGEKFMQALRSNEGLGLRENVSFQQLTALQSSLDELNEAKDIGLQATEEPGTAEG